MKIPNNFFDFINSAGVNLSSRLLWHISLLFFLNDFSTTDRNQTSKNYNKQRSTNGVR